MQKVYEYRSLEYAWQKEHVVCVPFIIHVFFHKKVIPLFIIIFTRVFIFTRRLRTAFSNFLVKRFHRRRIADKAAVNGQGQSMVEWNNRIKSLVSIPHHPTSSYVFSCFFCFLIPLVVPDLPAHQCHFVGGKKKE